MLDFQVKYDIAVAGAGVAGVAAALAAARRGHRVALIEKQTLIGGLATSGLVYVYLPLCDGHGTQVTFGIAEELLRHSLEYSPFDLPRRWGGLDDNTGDAENDERRFRCCFSPAGFTLSLDALLRDANVDLWLDTRVCAARLAKDGKVASLDVENSSGHGLIRARQFVDATGEATIVRRAGGATETDQNFATLWMLERAPLPPDRPPHYYFTDATHIQAWGRFNEEGRVKGDPREGRTVTDFIRDGWQYARDYYRASYASGQADRHTHYPLHLPAMPQLRKIARIHGIETLDTGSEWKRADSSVGLYADWRRPGKVYETPYGALLPKDVRGVLAAGRCISAAGDAWESYRVIPAAAMTGEVAGVAASLAVEQRRDASEFTPNQIRAELRKNHFRFRFEEVGLQRPPRNPRAR